MKNPRRARGSCVIFLYLDHKVKPYVPRQKRKLTELESTGRIVFSGSRDVISLFEGFLKWHRISKQHIEQLWMTAFPKK